MIKVNDWVKQLKQELNIDREEFEHELNDFLAINNWFDVHTEWNGNELMIEERISSYFDNFSIYFQNKRLPEFEKIELLSQMLSKFNTTQKLLSEFIQEFKISEHEQYYLYDFLLYELRKEIILLDDDEIEKLMLNAFWGLTKNTGDLLTSFLAWIKKSKKTRYHKNYVMSNRLDTSKEVQAYEMEEYLEFIYYLFNKDYIEKNHMYQKAAESKNYADTWLFLSLHFICALRKTDLLRLPHAKLTLEPEEVLYRVSNNTLDERDAKSVLYSIIWRLKSLPLKPNKTSSHNNISDIKFYVPQSIETHIGTLFAICEAHRLIQGIPNSEPLIRVISTYTKINSYMGEEIGNLFLNSNFRSRSANKSYLQAIYALTDDILDSDENDINMKGYMLASLARSHKGSYGEFSKTTKEYLKDAKLSGLTPEYVAKELFERGVLSFIPSMLLNMITDGEYLKLSVSNQTELIKILDMNPYEIERVIYLSSKSRKNATEISTALFKMHSKKEDILKILHRIGNGEAFSKQEDCLCIMSAMRKSCPYPDKRQCLSCPYQIGTKALVFHMVSEYNRIYKLYKNTTEELEKSKYKQLLEAVVLPTMDELLTCAQDLDENEYQVLMQLIKENITNE